MFSFDLMYLNEILLIPILIVFDNVQRNIVLSGVSDGGEKAVLFMDKG